MVTSEDWHDLIGFDNSDNMFVCLWITNCRININWKKRERFAVKNNYIEKMIDDSSDISNQKLASIQLLCSFDFTVALDQTISANSDQKHHQIDKVYRNANNA